MKTINKIKYIVVLLFTVISLNSCTFLNVSDELASELSLDDVFENAQFTRRFHRGIYLGIPNSSLIEIDNSYLPMTGLDNPWPTASDELKANCNNTFTLQTTGYHAGNASLSRWSLYKHIRQANIFLSKVHTIQSDKDPLKDDEVSALRAEARFLRAYYHFLLFELYGPIPIVTEVIDPSGSVIDFNRNSVDEVVTFLDKELKEVAEELKETEPKDRLAVPTKGVALAVRAKAWLYAASPLLNGGYQEAVNLRDNDGKQLFPTRDNTKWGKALSAMQEFIDYSNSHYKLFKVMTTTSQGADKKEVLDVNASLYGLFQNYNDEIIWASTKDSWGSVDSDGTQRRCTPRGVQGNFGQASVGVTQELVDAFFMKDGLDIKESPLYDKSESLFTSVTHDVSVFGKTQTFTDEIFNMYLNREPRFYQAVTYCGRRWQVGGDLVLFYKGGGDDNSSSLNCWTGYLLYKRINNTLYAQGSYPRSYYRPSILYRLAEFYLLYAEVLNEVDPSDTRIIEYLDKVRERAGIPLLKDIKPEIIGDQALQRKAIRHEMRIELCTEGQRYFDVRRWMVAESPTADEGGQGGDFHGMNMNAGKDGYFKRTLLEKRIFERRMYLYPIPLNEIQNSKKLIQNPGW